MQHLKVGIHLCVATLLPALSERSKDKGDGRAEKTGLPPWPGHLKHTGRHQALGLFPPSSRLGRKYHCSFTQASFNNLHDVPATRSKTNAAAHEDIRTWLWWKKNT